MQRPDERCVTIINSRLPKGKAANAAAVLALSMGAQHPHLVGEDLVDAAGVTYPGLIPIGITILSGANESIIKARDKALKRALTVVTFPEAGQTTTNYSEFRSLVKKEETESIQYSGIMIYGPRNQVSRIVGGLSLL